MRSNKQFGPWDGFVLILSMFAVAAVFAQGLSVLSLPSLPEPTIEILKYTDYALCAVFFADFLRELYRSEKKVEYLFGWGLLDLLSSIPAVEPLRIGRAGRAFRIIRLLRAARSLKYVRLAITTHRAESVVLFACLWVFAIGIFSSISILFFEPEGSPIREAGDAVWWSFGLLTNSLPPRLQAMSHAGEVLRALLSISGVVLLGVVTAGLADWFRSGRERARASENGDLDTL